MIFPLQNSPIRLKTLISSKLSEIRKFCKDKSEGDMPQFVSKTKVTKLSVKRGRSMLVVVPSSTLL